MSLWRRLACMVTGCRLGAWLPTVSDVVNMRSYLRQCRQCRRFEYRLRRDTEGPPP